MCRVLVDFNAPSEIHHPDFAERASRLLLKPFHLACGKTVFVSVGTKNPFLSQEKLHIILRIYMAIMAIILLPATLIGLMLASSSETLRKIHVRYIENGENARDPLTRGMSRRGRSALNLDIDPPAYQEEAESVISSNYDVERAVCTLFTEWKEEIFHGKHIKAVQLSNDICTYVVDSFDEIGTTVNHPANYLMGMHDKGNSASTPTRINGTFSRTYRSFPDVASHSLVNTACAVVIDESTPLASGHSVMIHEDTFVYIDLENDATLAEITSYLTKEFQLIGYSSQQKAIRIGMFVAAAFRGAPLPKCKDQYLFGDVIKVGNNNAAIQALLVKYLSDYFDLPCKFVATFAKPLVHAWCVMKLDGESYLMDSGRSRFYKIKDSQQNCADNVRYGLLRIWETENAKQPVEI